MNAVFSFQRILMLMLLLSIGFMNVHVVQAQDVADVTKTVQSYFKEKSRFTGNLDLYDAKIDKVRNLKLLQLDEKSLDASSDATKLTGEFRDVSSGDILDLEFVLKADGGEMMVDEVIIGKVKEAAEKKNAAKADKKYTKEDAQKAMQAYVDKMSKFTGTYGLFDEKREKMRQLKMLRMDEKVRNFGILFISTIDFKDVDTNETIVTDMTVENKGGRLKVKSVKIKKVIKP